MTTPPVPQPKERVKVEPPPGSRLETLLCELHLAEQEEVAAKARAEEADKAVRAELQAIRAADNQPDVYDVAGHPSGAYPPYSFYWTPATWILDGKRLKETEPAKWVEYAKPKKGFWTLKKS